MFEKVVYNVLLCAGTIGVIACVGGAVYSLVSMIREDRQFDRVIKNMQTRHDRQNAMIEEMLMKSVQEAE